MNTEELDELYCAATAANQSRLLEKMFNDLFVYDKISPEASNLASTIRTLLSKLSDMLSSDYTKKFEQHHTGDSDERRVWKG